MGGWGGSEEALSIAVQAAYVLCHTIGYIYHKLQLQILPVYKKGKIAALLG